MEEKKGLVSIILNCYNGEKYLHESIGSVLKQKYNNWELIFWDNHSSDNSKKIFHSFKSEKLKYFYSDKHTTLYEARNLAEKKCKGEFIAFIDADDIWEENKLKKQITLFENKRVGVVYGNLWIYNERAKKKKIFSQRKLLSGSIFDKIFSDYRVGIITSVIRRNILIKNYLSFNPKYNHIGDFDLFVNLSKICEFGAIQEPVATYRIHGENLSLKNSTQEIMELKYWFEINKKSLNETQKQQFLIRLTNREFINFKLNDTFFKTLKFFIKQKSLWKYLKNYLFLLLPLSILKKFLWYQ